MEYKRLTVKGAKLDKKQFIGTNYGGGVSYEFNEEALDNSVKVFNRLAELEDKIEQGTLIELPCIIVGNGAIDAFGKIRVPYYQVLWLDEFGFMKIFKTTDREEAEKRLKELQNG